MMTEAKKLFRWTTKRGDSPISIRFFQSNEPRFDGIRPGGFFFVDWVFETFVEGESKLKGFMTARKKPGIFPFEKKSFSFKRIDSGKKGRNKCPRGYFENDYFKFGEGWTSITSKGKNWGFEFKPSKDIIALMNKKKKPLLFRMRITTYGIDFSKAERLSQKDYQLMSLICTRYCQYGMTGKGLTFDDMIDNAYVKDWNKILQTIADQGLANDLFNSSGAKKSEIVKIISEADKRRGVNKAKLTFENLRSIEPGFGKEIIAYVLFEPQDFSGSVDLDLAEAVLQDSREFDNAFLRLPINLSTKNRGNDDKGSVPLSKKESAEKKVEDDINFFESFDVEDSAWGSEQLEKPFKELFEFFETHTEEIKRYFPRNLIIRSIVAIALFRYWKTFSRALKRNKDKNFELMFRYSKNHDLEELIDRLGIKPDLEGLKNSSIQKFQSSFKFKLFGEELKEAIAKVKNK